MSGCSSVTRSFNSSCLFVMLLIFSCRSVKSFWLGCDVVACECVVELSVVVWVVRAEGGSLRFWGPGLLSTSPAFSMSSASHSAGSSGWLAPKTGAGPTFQWAGEVDAICRSISNRAKRPRAGCILRSTLEILHCLRTQWKHENWPGPIPATLWQVSSQIGKWRPTNSNTARQYSHCTRKSTKYYMIPALLSGNPLGTLWRRYFLTLLLTSMLLSNSGPLDSRKGTTNTNQQLCWSD